MRGVAAVVVLVGLFAGIVVVAGSDLVDGVGLVLVPRPGPRPPPPPPLRPRRVSTE